VFRGPQTGKDRGKGAGGNGDARFRTSVRHILSTSIPRSRSMFSSQCASKQLSAKNAPYPCAAYGTVASVPR
jgi:hypothetical protein